MNKPEQGTMRPAAWADFDQITAAAMDDPHTMLRELTSPVPQHARGVGRDTEFLNRKPNRHYAFGFGAHRCLGANLARVELQVLIQEVLRRLPDYQVVPAEVVRYPGLNRGMSGPGARFTPGYLVMATGNLTVGKRPDFKGLDSFRGRWVLSNDSAHYTFPARNHPLTPDDQRETQSASELREVFCALPGATRMPVPTRPFSDYTPEEAAVLEKQWDSGGQAIMFRFADQSRNTEAAEYVSGFVRDKIRGRVPDQDLAESLIPSYPLGVKRIALESHFYETLQRDDVTLVNLKKEPLVEVTETGIRTEAGLYEVDLIIFAIGFAAFNGALDSAGIVNEAGERPTDQWSRGPRTLLGLMTPGFPNMFVPTGPGSPSVIANLIVQNEFALDWIGDLIAYADRNGYRSIEPTEEAVDAWVDEGYKVSEKSIRRLHDNYMVKVNDDGTRILIPYAGGFRAYVAECRRIAESCYKELHFR